MQSFSDYLSQGHGWLFIPAAIVLGALHGLEPGHSKTLMAAFITSIRGTVAQAVLLGLAAALSHTVVIWVLAAAGLHYAGQLDVEGLEPWFQVGTGVIIVAMALWMFRRVRREQRNARAFQHQHGPHDGMLVTTGHSQVLEISVFETGVPPRFRIHFFDSTLAPVGPPKHETVTLETVRPDGARQTFAFANTGDYLEATSELPEPHEFTAQINLAHGGHAHTYAIKFVEGHHHQQHAPANVMTAEYQDAHERGHAQELHARFTSQTVTTKQIILFGLTGGLLPCPAAFAVLLVCLQIKQFALGFAVVLAFSVGLAVTLVAIGSAAALSMRAASRRFAGVSRLARRLPYASAGLMSVIGLVVTAFGLRALLR